MLRCVRGTWPYMAKAIIKWYLWLNVFSILLILRLSFEGVGLGRAKLLGEFMFANDPSAYVGSFLGVFLELALSFFDELVEWLVE